MEGGPDSSHGQGGALFIWAAVFFLGCTGRYQPEAFQPALPSQEQALASLPLEETLQAAVRARERGDFGEAIELLSILRSQGQTTPELTYQLAIALEEAQLYSQSVGLYREISRGPPSPRKTDAAFREALCLWQLGEDRAAARSLRHIPQSGEWELSDRYKLDLALGVSWLRTGKSRRGQKRIIVTLSAAEGSSRVGFMRALAVHALMEHTLTKAVSLDLQVREKHQFRDLQQRVVLLQEAEDLLRRLMVLGEIHWMLEGWLALGDAYMAFAEDLSQAPYPKGLTTEQKTHYRSGLSDQALALQRKGLLAYDRGLEVAIRAGRQDLHSAKSLQSRLSESMGPREPNPKPRTPPQ